MFDYLESPENELKSKLLALFILLGLIIIGLVGTVIYLVS